MKNDHLTIYVFSHMKSFRNDHHFYVDDYLHAAGV